MRSSRRSPKTSKLRRGTLRAPLQCRRSARKIVWISPLRRPLRNCPKSLCRARVIHLASSALRRTGGAGEGIRTPDRLITNQLLYRTELRQPRQKIICSTHRATAQLWTGKGTRKKGKGHILQRFTTVQLFQHFPLIHGQLALSLSLSLFPCRLRSLCADVQPQTARRRRQPTHSDCPPSSHRNRDTRRSQRSRTSRRRPLPSAPSTTAVGSVKSTSSYWLGSRHPQDRPSRHRASSTPRSLARC